MQKGVDAEWLLAGYHAALKGLPLEAVEAVAERLNNGTWYTDVTFCPRPPDLAKMVRKEAAMMAERRKPHVPMIAVARPYVSLPERDQQRRAEMIKEGWEFVCEGGLEKYSAMAKKRDLPVGSTCLWAIGEIWSPPSKAKSGRVAA